MLEFDIDLATCKMPSDEAEWSSKIYNEEACCCYNDHLRLRFGLGEIPSHHHALFPSALGPCNKQILPSERSG